MLNRAIRHIRQLHGGVAKASRLSAWLLVGGFLLTGCSADTPDSPANGEATEVTLSLNVAVADNGQKLTRATIPADSDNPQDGDYQEPANNAEKINTLRVIIVAADGTVEHNRVVNCDQDGNPVNDNLRFLVKTETQDGSGNYPKKDIYLFANEQAANAAIYESLRTLISNDPDNLNPDPTQHGGMPFDLIRPGHRFQAGLVNGIIYGREAGQPLIAVTADKSDTGVVTIPAKADQYIPMSEHFQLEVSPKTAKPAQAPGSGGNLSRLEQTANLFVTRAATKFTFRAKLGQNFPAGYGMRITSITVSQISDREYLLPQATVYNPTKDFAINPANTYEGLTITGYTTPAGAGNSGYTFTLPAEGLVASAYAATAPAKYSPLEYLPETGILSSGAFTVTVTADLTAADGSVSPIQENKTFGPETLTGMQQFDSRYGMPRNTHVYVDLEFRNYSELNATVTLVPYIGVWLNPGFGIDRD